MINLTRKESAKHITLSYDAFRIINGCGYKLTDVNELEKKANVYITLLK